MAVQSERVPWCQIKDRRLREVLAEVSSDFQLLKMIKQKKDEAVVQAVDLATGESVVLKCGPFSYHFETEWRIPLKLKLPFALQAQKRLFADRRFGVMIFPCLEKCGRLPQSWRTWLAVLDELLTSLAAMHAQQFAHLDIKPDNILISRQGNKIQMTLIDFGLSEYCAKSEQLPYASLLEQPEGEEDWCGTLPYVDPVMLKYGQASVQSDMWSLGIMLAHSVFCDFHHIYSRPYSRQSILEECSNVPDRLEECKMKIAMQDSSMILLRLLRAMLVVDPDLRISASEALLQVRQLFGSYRHKLLRSSRKW